MAEPRKRRREGGAPRKRPAREPDREPDHDDDEPVEFESEPRAKRDPKREAERDEARRKRLKEKGGGGGGGGGGILRLVKLVLVLVLLLGGWLGYRVWSKGGDLTDPESYKEAAREAAAETRSSWQKLDPEDLKGLLAKTEREVQDFFDKNPDAQPIESQEQLDDVLAEELAPIEDLPTEPDPKRQARQEAREEYGKAKQILRSWSPGDDRSLHQALDHLDRALARAEEAGDENMVTKVMEMRYFCLKSHSTK